MALSRAKHSRVRRKRLHCRLQYISLKPHGNSSAWRSRFAPGWDNDSILNRETFTVNFLLQNKHTTLAENDETLISA